MSSRIKMTREQIAAFLKDPDAIKTMERLLAVADSIRDGTREPVAITGNYTVTSPINDLLVNATANVTITLAADLPPGAEVRITRLGPKTHSITVVTSGSDTIEGVASFVTHGTTVSAVINSSQVVIKKITDVYWRFVGGEVSGSDANGSYIKYADGTMECWKKQAWALIATSPPITRWEAWMLPASFIDTNFVITVTATDPGGSSWSTIGLIAQNGLLANAAFVNQANLGFYPYVGSTNVTVKYDGYCIGRWRA